MRRAQQIIRAESVPGNAAVDRVILEFDQRHRRRIALTTETGQSILLDRDETTRLQHGDAMVLEDGELVLVIAAPEKLIEIEPQNVAALVRIAWHLGNRHLPTQIIGERLRIREDHVIADMIQHLGGELAFISAPFEPEGGAYDVGVVQGHSHHHEGGDHGDHGPDHE
jgi:urease accessory protein